MLSKQAGRARPVYAPILREMPRRIPFNHSGTLACAGLDWRKAGAAAAQAG